MMFLQNQTKANRTSYLNFFQTSTLLIQENASTCESYGSDVP